MMRSKKKTVFLFVSTVVFIFFSISALRVIVSLLCDGRKLDSSLDIYVANEDSPDIDVKQSGALIWENGNRFEKALQADRGSSYNTNERDGALTTETSVPDVEINNDLFANISYDDIIHVVESNAINEKEFMNWAYNRANTLQTNRLYKWWITGETICNSLTELIIVIPAVPDQQFTREIIRQTWAGIQYGIPWPGGRKMSLNTKIVFLFGTDRLPNFKRSALTVESETYHDVIASEFVDSYRNLTLKMLTGLQWVKLYCPQARFILKADMDTFVNLPLMTKMISVVASKLPRFVLGHKHRLSEPPVLRSGRWKVEEADYPFPFFPPYVIGHTYVISTNVIPALLSLGKMMPMLPTEDSHITGVLSRALKVPRVHFEGFGHLKKRPFPCDIVHNYAVSMTKMSLSRMVIMWRMVLTNTCTATELPVLTNIIKKQKPLKIQPPRGVEAEESLNASDDDEAGEDM